LGGANFLPGSVARVNGNPIPTQYGHEEQLYATIPASYFAQAGTLTVDVFNAAPGGGASNTRTVTVSASNPVPVLNSMYPTEARAGSHDLELTANAAANTLAPSGAQVRVDGQLVPTVYGPESTLRFTLPASKLANTGSIRVEISNPGPGGGVSNHLLFNVVATGNAVPSISSVSPSSIARSNNGVRLRLNGSGFASGTAAYFDGVWVSKIVQNSTAMDIDLTPLLTNQAGTYSIRVQNGQPGGGSSAPVSFTITGNNPAPTVTSVSPSSLGEGTANYRVQVKGADFLRKTAVSATKGTTTTDLGFCSFQIQGECTVTLPASLLASAGTITLTFTNPAPGGGSATATVTVAGNPTPQLSNFTPYTLVKNGGDQTISAAGSGFSSGSFVFDVASSTPLSTSFVSSTKLTAVMPNALLGNVGVRSLRVETPGPGGGVTTTANVNVVAVPVLTSLSPSTVAAGSPDLTLTLNGTDLDQPSYYGIVKLNGAWHTPATRGASWTVVVPGSM
ncbi:MAG: hypothetical protein ACK4N5_19070, partial [Myxococcales bacterium]